MRTFHIQTLGCKVNHYESEQIAMLLRSRGLLPTDNPALADIRVVNTCSVTTQAASQSRQSVRRVVRLPIFQPTRQQPAVSSQITESAHRSKVIVTGCWATSDTAEASALPGLDAVLTHQHQVALELDRLLTLWQTEESSGEEHQRKAQPATPASQFLNNIEPNRYEGVNDLSAECGGEGGMQNAEVSAECRVRNAESQMEKTIPAPKPSSSANSALFILHSALTPTLHSALISPRQHRRQRAFLKIQDGCDAHCTYCIIPSLRPTLWSKPIDSVVEEAMGLVAVGHLEIILTGIFLGAYGQPTALRRRQPQSTAKPLAELIEALCTRVPGLRRLRLSSLEPGDLTAELISILRSHPTVVPHFHLPLQSGSDALLRRMNRQYTRDDFLKMIDRVRNAFDRPALTTDIVVGFPGESNEEFDRTTEVVRAAKFIHVHAFPYSARPGTAAARWTKQFVRGPIVNERIHRLREIAEEQSLAFRSTFVGETVEVIVERDAESPSAPASARHGRCERYFPVTLDDASVQPGDSVRVRISQVTGEETYGQVVRE